jgi:hypothetical protein
MAFTSGDPHQLSHCLPPTRATVHGVRQGCSSSANWTVKVGYGGGVSP